MCIAQFAWKSPRTFPVLFVGGCTDEVLTPNIFANGRFLGFHPRKQVCCNIRLACDVLDIEVEPIIASWFRTSRGGSAKLIRHTLAQGKETLTQTFVFW